MSDLFQLIAVIVGLGITLGVVIFGGAGLLVVAAVVIDMIREATYRYLRKD